eukprot:262824_1
METSLILWCTTLLSLYDQFHASNVGLIGYFDGDCAEGWEEYSDLRGRFILGAGLYVWFSENGRTETKFYSKGDHGGEINHTMTESETKSHSHYEFASSALSEPYRTYDVNKYAPRSTAPRDTFNNFDAYIIAGSTREADIFRSSSFGNDDPYTMQKMEDEIDSLKARVDLLEKQITSTLYPTQTTENNLLSTKNDNPEVVDKIQMQYAILNEHFEYQISEDLFTDPWPSGDELRYVATMADGSVSPQWLFFNEDALAFFGTPTNKSDVGNVYILITAYDDKGGDATVYFVINVKDKTTNPSSKNIMDSNVANLLDSEFIKKDIKDSRLYRLRVNMYRDK